MLGSHLSIAGGLHNALLSAERLQLATVQVFTKNQQQWRCPALSADAIAQWVAHQKRLSFRHSVSHDSYLINIASPDRKLWRQSADLLTEELVRCVLLKIPYLVMHPGAHMGEGEAKGIARIAEALDLVQQRVGPNRVTICLEVTAGQGSSIGHRLEHLAQIIDKVEFPRRLGVCLDTAHLFAAGYDFRGSRYDELMDEVDATVGLKRVKVWHLNDSKKELGSRVDRHAHIGHGCIGAEAFKSIMRDPQWHKVPKIIETPKENDESGREWDEINLQTLRALCG